MAVRRVLMLGGYGNFGKRITKRLSVMQGIYILVAGRNLQKAEKLCQQLCLGGANAVLEAVAMDIFHTGLINQLKSLAPNLVIHTGGPFQGQDYRVAEACIAAGSHYIDLADDRRFVCDITSLNAKALANKVLIVSGASSVPGLSSAVIDGFINQFSSLDTINFAIAPGNQVDRGEATVRGILSYTGHPFAVFYRGKWVKRHGWMSPGKWSFDDVIGKRWLANVDIPDLELFPERYRPVNTVGFQAGLELPLLHFSMVFMAGLAKAGVVKDWSVLTRPIVKASNLFRGLGTDIGGMQINLAGLDNHHQPKHIKWTLCAEHGEGPYIPTISAIILAKKLITGVLETRGATPCLGMYTLAEFDREATSPSIYHQTETNIG